MSRYKYFLLLLFTSFTNVIYGNVILNDLSFRKDECRDICGDNFFLLPLVNDASIICQRGCRLFNIIDAKGDLDINKTRNDCHSSCIEAYETPDFEACKLGCNEMQKKRESDLSKGFVLYIEQEGQNNVMVLQPDIDQIDLDILGDPGLHGQIDLGYSVEYKIPEAHIRTMPINDASDNYGIPPDMTLKQYQPTGDWLDCASRNSGIPRWILISAILLAILLGIWLIFASEKREPIQTHDQGSDLNSDTDPLVCNIESFPVPPPKYSLESETV